MHVDLVTVSGHMYTEVQTITCDADVQQWINVSPLATSATMKVFCFVKRKTIKVRPTQEDSERDTLTRLLFVATKRQKFHLEGFTFIQTKGPHLWGSVGACGGTHLPLKLHIMSMLFVLSLYRILVVACNVVAIQTNKKRKNAPSPCVCVSLNNFHFI